MSSDRWNISVSIKYPFVGVTDAQHLWNATMDGEYPEFPRRRRGQCAATGSSRPFIADTRHWGAGTPISTWMAARAMALEDVEYVSYVEHPGPPVEITVEKHGYDVSWFNPCHRRIAGAEEI